MESVRLHVAATARSGLCPSASCGEVSKHLAADAIIAPVAYPKCGRQMDIKGARIETVTAAKASGVRRDLSAEET